MSFKLINASATFQWAIDSSFKDLREKTILIYLYDLIVFSKKRKDHLKDLCTILQRCREHGISLIPKNSIFFFEEEKFLGHIMSKRGVLIDPKKIKGS